MLHAHSSIAHCTMAGLLSLQQVEATKPQQRCMTTPMPTNGRQVCISLFLICNFDLISVSFFILIAVGSLPTTHDSSFYGARALPSTTGNGALVRKLNKIFNIVMFLTPVANLMHHPLGGFDGPSPVCGIFPNLPDLSKVGCEYYSL